MPSLVYFDKGIYLSGSAGGGEEAASLSGDAAGGEEVMEWYFQL
jgi:hypothetical protein